MTYYECWLIVEGAMDADIETADWNAAARWMAQQIIECDNERAEGAAYFIPHAHPMNVECECFQYQTSHLPYLQTTFGMAPF